MVERTLFPRMCKLVSSATVSECRSRQKKNSANIVVYQLSPWNIDTQGRNVYTVNFFVLNLEFYIECNNIGRSSTVNTVQFREIVSKTDWRIYYIFSVAPLCRCFLFGCLFVFPTFYNFVVVGVSNKHLYIFSMYSYI